MQPKHFFHLTMMCTVFFSACSGSKTITQPTQVYTPDDPVLYDAIVHMDSIFFNAYNTCDMKTQAMIYDDSIEFYNDKSGLSTSKQDVVTATEKNICGKVTRELIKGSMEVYPLKGYGAVEMGTHIFHNKLEPDAIPHPGKFILIWQLKNEQWKIKRVISLH